MRLPLVGIAVVICASTWAQAPASNPLERSRTFVYEQIPARTNANGTESRNFFSGTLATGEAIAVHESVQPAGTKAPALHAIQHSEIIVIEEGVVEYHHDGQIERAGPGSILYVKIGTEHFVVNAGGGPAKYAVIQIGGDVKR